MKLKKIIMNKSSNKSDINNISDLEETIIIIKNDVQELISNNIEKISK